MRRVLFLSSYGTNGDQGQFFTSTTGYADKICKNRDICRRERWMIGCFSCEKYMEVKNNT